MSRISVIGSTSASQETGTSLILTTPTGTLAADYIVASCVIRSSSITTPSGWTLIKSGTIVIGSVSYTYGIFGRYVAVGNPSTYDLSLADFVIAGLTTFRGVNSVTAVNTSNNATFGSTTVPSGAGVTTTTESYLALVGVGGNTSTGRTTSGYAIANSNPSWTEQIDKSDNDGSDQLYLALATAPWDNIGATGSATLTFSGTTSASALALIAFQPEPVRPSVIGIALSILAPTYMRSMVPSIVGSAVTAFDAAVTIVIHKWTNKEKHQSTWDNQPKS